MTSLTARKPRSCDMDIVVSVNGVVLSLSLSVCVCVCVCLSVALASYEVRSQAII